MNDRRQVEIREGPLVPVILKLALPMLVSSLLQNAQSLIDLFWIGRLGAAPVAALAIGGTVMMMLFPLLVGMAVGTVAVVSRRIGERDARGASDAAGQALGMAMLLGLLAGGVGMVFAGRLPLLLGAEPEAAGLATAYLRIQFMGSFTLFLLFVGGHAIFQACGNTVMPMLIMIFSNLVNLLLDPVLIFGLFGFPALGIEGAALATVIAQALAAAVALLVLGRGRGGIRLNVHHILPRPRLALHLLRIGLPGTGQMLARSLMVLALMRIAAGSGTAAMAAFGIGHRLHMLILMPAFAFGSAAATLVGQNMGAGQPARAARGAWLAAGMDMVVMAMGGALLMGFAPSLMRFFSADPDVILIGARLLRITSGLYVFAGLSIVLGRALQGAGETVTPMVLTIFSLWGLELPLAWFLNRVMTPPTDGIWWAMGIAVTVHGLLVAAWFRRGAWQRRDI